MDGYEPDSFVIRLIKNLHTYIYIMYVYINDYPYQIAIDMYMYVCIFEP